MEVAKQRARVLEGASRPTRIACLCKINPQYGVGDKEVIKRYVIGAKLAINR